MDTIDVLGSHRGNGRSNRLLLPRTITHDHHIRKIGSVAAEDHRDIPGAYRLVDGRKAYGTDYQHRSRVSYLDGELTIRIGKSGVVGVVLSNSHLGNTPAGTVLYSPRNSNLFLYF